MTLLDVSVISGSVADAHLSVLAFLLSAIAAPFKERAFFGKSPADAAPIRDMPPQIFSRIIRITFVRV